MQVITSRTLILATALMILSACTGANNPGKSAETEVIKQLYADYRAAVEAGSINGYISVLDPEVRLLPPGVDPIEGATNYAQFLEPVFASADYRIEVVSLPEISIEGDVATAEYEYIMHLQLKDSARGINQPGALTDQQTRSRYFDVLRKSPTGKWAIWRHTWHTFETQNKNPED
jgi:ketosteroid isomerase-like protein